MKSSWAHLSGTHRLQSAGVSTASGGMSHVTLFNESHKSKVQTRPCVLAFPFLNAAYLVSSSLLFLSSSSWMKKCAKLLFTSQTEPWERRHCWDGWKFISYLKRPHFQWGKNSAREQDGTRFKSERKGPILTFHSQFELPVPPAASAGDSSASDSSDQSVKGMSGFSCGGESQRF